MSRQPPRFLLVLLVAASAAFAHPLGNFTVAHYSRLRVTPEAVLLRYVIDMAEIPAFQEMPHLDANQDRVASAAEKRSYLRRKVPDLASLLTVQLNGKPLSLRIESGDLTTPPGEMGLPTLRIVADFRAQLPRERLEEDMVFYEDRNFAGRAGWKGDRG